ncbi:MAG: GyrI-like domain-containing protein [Sedimentisphaerales bacterium]|nr:GyrI-like domain-containing protein [Sedimentisphaerales bacterium]
MTRTKCCAVAGALALTAVIAGGLWAAANPAEPSFEVRKTAESVVLYTIHRGPFDQVGATIRELMTMAAPKGLIPRGPISFMYLTNPELTPSAHWLTEIRIPVGEDALRLSGTLGKLTDVKKLAPIDVVVGTKSEGMADPGPVYHKLYPWLLANSYVPIEGPREVFLTNAETSDYSKMRTEIMVPVRPVATEK